MGGNLYSDGRFSREKHDEVYQNVSQVLQSMSLYHDIIPFCHDKDSFGDVDIVMVSEETTEETWDEIRERLKEQISEEVEYSSTSNSVRIYGVGGVQVDMNPQPRHSVELYRDFFAWNGINMILNVMLQNLGLKLSITKGFRLKYNEFFEYDYDRWYYYHIPIEHVTMEKICKILELDPVQYSKGFRNMEEIFRYVETSQYFTPAVFDLTGKKSKDRKRMSLKSLITDGAEYFKDYDRTQYPRKVDTREEILANVANVFGQHWVDDFIKTSRERYITQESLKHLRNAKSHMLMTIHEQYAPHMSYKTFKSEVINPLYLSKRLNSDSTLEEIARELILELGCKSKGSTDA